MPPKGKSKKKTHSRGGPKYVSNAEEIQLRNQASGEAEQRRGFFDDDADGDDLPIAGGGGLILDEEDEGVGRKVKAMPTHNPNAEKQKNLKISDLAALAANGDDGAEPRLSRKERDEREAEERKAAYQKLHKEGKTDEYKKDMERLQAAKARREAQAVKKKEVEEANAIVEAAMRAAAISGAGGSDDDSEDEAVAKLDPREVKKMNPKQLKEALKARNLSIQGSKKDLIARLLEA